MDIVQRLRFDAARCELQFSKGVAGNIEEAAAEIERLRETIAKAFGNLDVALSAPADVTAENERLRAALKPFAEVGRPFVNACQTGAIPSGASARYLKLEPLIAEDFARAAEALASEQKVREE